LAAATVTQTGKQEDANGVIQTGRDKLIEMLGQFGITGDEAQRYADKLGLIPGNVNTSVDLTDNASAKLLTIQEMLDSIPAYKQITVNATMRQSGVGDIDHDPNTPYAYGGYTGPGGKWDVAGVVHRGEWVFDQEKTPGTGHCSTTSSGAAGSRATRMAVSSRVIVCSTSPGATPTRGATPPPCRSQCISTAR
jgi:hypothetical protein